jgi:CDP-diacylglycerol--glycerol-3-phosphate 3-phosphatidyltransferase
VSSVVAETSRRLPRGWAHLAFQFVIWMGFYVAYQVARGAADRSVYDAFQNGEWVLRTERHLGTLFEPAVQRVVDTSSILVTLTSFTYWLSQFAVVGATLLWVYFRHQDRFARFRNWLIVANLVGLVGYILVPTAPPRMFPEWGFVDTLAQYSSVNHDSGVIAFASNPYAAMPSLHAMDALIVGIVMFGLVRTRLAKALWMRMTDEKPASKPASVSQLDRVKQEYTAAAREILARSMRGVAKTKLTPDMLTLAGVSLCLAGAVLVGFEERNEKLFFWLGGAFFVVGSIADILDGALARAASKGTVFGAFLDSTFDRLGEAAMLTAIGLVFMREGNEVALVATFAAVIGSFLVSYTRAKAEALGLRGDVGFGSRVERVVLISVGLGLAPWGLLQWPIYLLAAMAWITVFQRMLFVRRQLRELAEASG